MTGLRRAGPLAVALCCLTLLAGWWSKARCLGDGGWENSEQYLGWCYTDIFPLWGSERLNEGARPYLDHPVEYPVLTGAQMYLGQQVAELADEDQRSRVFFHATAVSNAVLSLVVLGLIAAAGAPRRRLTWWALAPALAVYAFLNWDPLAVALLTGAVLAHLRGRELTAGVLAGLGVAAKLIPGVVIPLIIAARLAQRRPRDAVLHGAGAAGAWLVVNLPIIVVAPDGWRRFFELNRERVANFDSLWYVVQQQFRNGEQFLVSTVNLWSAAIFLAGVAVIVAVGTRRRDPSGWWALSLPILCWFLVTNKVYSPQYTLWLLPLAALSLRRLAPYVAFLLSDFLLFLIEFPFLAGVSGEPGAPSFDLFAIALVIRYGMLLWITVESTLDHDPSLTTDGLVEDPAPPAARALPRAAEVPAAP